MLDVNGVAAHSAWLANAELDVPHVTRAETRAEFLHELRLPHAIELEMQPGEPLDIWVIEQRPGLPDNLLKVPLPQDFIYRPGYISNSTQVKYELKL